MGSARRVIAILGAGGTLGTALSRQLAAEPDTDLVLSDLSEDALAQARDEPRRERRGGGDRAGRHQRLRRGRERRQARGRPLRPPRRADQQRRGAGAQRPDPQPQHRGLGAVLPHQRARPGQRHQGGRPGDARPAVRLDHPHRLGGRAHRLEPLLALLRHQGRRHPPGQGRRGRVRPRRHPRQLRLPGHLPVRHAHRPARRGGRRHRGQAPARPRLGRRPGRRLLLPGERRLPVDHRLGDRRRRRLRRPLRRRLRQAVRERPGRLEPRYSAT